MSEALVFPIALSDVLIEVKKSSFFDFFDSFELLIKGTGEVFLKPHGVTVDEPGIILSDISPEVIKDLISNVLEINFFDMKDDYDQKSILGICSESIVEQIEKGITDLPSFEITITLGKTSKSVYAYYGFPKRLKAFYNRVLRVSGVKEWMKEFKRGLRLENN